MDAFIDNIIIKTIGFKTTTHDCCIYCKIIAGEVIYLLRHIDNCCCDVCNQKRTENLFIILGTKMGFKSKEEKGIIPFEFLGVFRDFNGFNIKQMSHYIDMSCENYIHCLS